MTYKIPTNEEGLIVLLASDSYQQLVDTYNAKFKTINGRTISDVAQVWELLVAWDAIDRQCLKIPFTFGHPRNEPRGYRVWYLSLPTDNTYYHGNFFDLRITSTHKRIIRKQCRLSKAAIQLFQKHPEIMKNEAVNVN